MAQVSMTEIKKLREQTHVGLMDCKKALLDADGDYDKAVELLRKKGAAVAAKRADNVTNEGIISTHIADNLLSGSLVELGCETDFAANTEHFKKASVSLAQQAQSAPVDSDTFLTTPLFDNPSATVEEGITNLISKISENIKIANVIRFAVSENGIVQSYIHAGAHLGTMVLLTTNAPVDDKKEAVAQLAKDICMQIAVTNPLCIQSDSLDQELVNKERAHHKEQLIAAGKPEAMIDKIVEGKIKKYYEDVCLLNQKFIKNDKITISKQIETISKETGLSITIEDFARFSIGK